MKCPIREQGKHPQGGDTPHAFADCLQSECAWWDEHLEGCSVKWLTRGVYDLIADIHTYIHNTSGGERP